jgi:hypothetical protein
MSIVQPNRNRGSYTRSILVGMGFLLYALGFLACLLGQNVLRSSFAPWEPLQLFAMIPASSAAGKEDDLNTYLSLRSDARKAFHLDDPAPGVPTTKAASARRADGGTSTPRARALTIAQYSHVYGPSGLWADKSGTWASCRLPCQAVGKFQDAVAAAAADVVVLSLQDFRQAPWKRPPGQLWVGTYFESPAHYPNLEKRAVVSQFNVTMGFRPDAEVPVFSMLYDTFKDFGRLRNYTLPTWEAKRAGDMAMMSVWISNCGVETTHRTVILDELASHGVTYASYGGCKNTHSPAAGLARVADEDWKQYGTTEGAGAELVAAATPHLFFYAAENSDYPYYITEKVFHGLLAGSVPVYIGDATHLKMIAPPRSIIYAEDYGSVRILAAHLKAVASDPALYESYLEWRSDPESVRQLERVMALPQWAAENPEGYACALCEHLHSYFVA